jgi:AbrB family looped-hinge helix DNA binding protein
VCELLEIAGDCGIVVPKIDVAGYSYVSPKFIGNDPVLILEVEVPPMSVEEMMPVEFVTTTKMGEKGQVTVPKRYRDALKLETGAPMVVLRLGAGLLLIPEQARFRQLCDRIADIFTSHGVTEAELLASLPEARRRVFERHYPELAKTEKASSRKPRKRKTA